MSEIISMNQMLAAGGIAAPEIPYLGWLTNSIFVAVIVTGLILFFVRSATKKIELIPSGKQNFLEALIEFLYAQVENIVGKHVAPKAFPLLGTAFILILTSNWFGLLPGIGTIGFGVEGGSFALKEVTDPILRPPTADLNMTLAIALVFMVVWLWLSVSELGVWGTLVHIFGPKGGLQGFLKYALTPLFFVVGLIEVVSIMFRPMSLSLRLLGNVFAGETLLHTMGNLGAMLKFNDFMQFVASVFLPIPFYFLEILVGALQATVFTILCAVYIKLSTSHDDEGHEAH